MMSAKHAKLRRQRVVAILGCSFSLFAAQQGSAQSTPVLPTGERVVAGDIAVMRNAGGTMTVSQTAPAAIVAWNDFSIGKGGAVHFDNGGGATLNRVDGTAVSRLDGSLSASGSLYLINPQGIVVGRSGVVDVGGSFVASTLDVDDSEFLARGDRTFTGPSRGAVVNLGRVGALGGDVAFIATQVRNDGSVSAPGGSAELLAGSSVLLFDVEYDRGRFAVLAGGLGDSVTNSGTIRAISAALRAEGGSVYALAGNTSGITRADAVQIVGDQIILAAGEGGTVNVGATTLSATGVENIGYVEVTGSTINVAQGATLDVSGAYIGGQIYVTAGDRLNFAGTGLSRGGIQGGDVVLSAPQLDFIGTADTTGGEYTGNLYLFLPSVVIDGRKASAISRSVRTSNVSLVTAADFFGGTYEDGDITIAAPFSLSGNNRLTLAAQDALRFDANVTVGGNASIDLTAGGGDGGMNIAFAPNRSLTFAAPTAASTPALLVNDEPYKLIYNLADLRAIGSDHTASYALARSISASSAVLSGPVAGGQGEEAFAGDFDGLGHSITGLRIEAPDTYAVGLFGNVNGSIRNLALVGGSVVGGSLVGAVAAAISDGSIARTTSSASVMARSTSPSGTIGGLVGSVYLGSVVDSSATGNVYAPGSSDVGGLVGSIYGTSVIRSFATGNVTGAQLTGGLVGSVSRASIAASYATGRVIGTIDVGGLVGAAAYAGGVYDSRASGRVSGIENVGGLVGRQLDAGVTNSSASGAVSASAYNGGGLVGVSYDGGVFSSTASGRVTGGDSLGGLIGSMNATTVQDVAASGSVTASGSGVGGLVGRASSSTIERAVASGAVQGFEAVGGLVGAAPGLTVDASSASGAVRGTTSVGGLIGAAGSRYGSYSDSFATGAVSGQTNVGGLIGSADNVGISGSFASGTVTGNSRSLNIGGLVGSLFASGVVDSFAEGRVTGAGNVGGLVGTSFATTMRGVVARGTVNGTLGSGENVGGLIGRSEIDDILDANALNSVRGRTNVGGLIGSRSGGTLGDVSATGPVSGTSNVGPLIGQDDPTP
ncbi:beta strand repeat-containing protein [Sphingomonas radiodurans]|uniref:beta strand repeat-containing protein n=1 Tax=Sphingomonas radiodurans TaxID=2890321 RepID=UPI001E286E5B|nr:GLUG motif-containing protein [Sphingomonas radiodurans]WBH15016.1 filamentous hemagglutinin N-terminal domain-containing protein [Sphingomonas radiodurans]